MKLTLLPKLRAGLVPAVRPVPSATRLARGTHVAALMDLWMHRLAAPASLLGSFSFSKADGCDESGSLNSGLCGPIPSPDTDLKHVIYPPRSWPLLQLRSSARTGMPV